MKKIPTVIDKCSDCPSCIFVTTSQKELRRYVCSRIFRQERKSLLGCFEDRRIEGPIPDWCPLEEVDPVEEWAKKCTEMGNKIREQEGK